MYPTKLIPAVKAHLWGGKQLKEKFEIETADDILAEAWMLSCNPSGAAIIPDGSLKGKSLEQVIFGDAESAIGSCFGISRFFPVLVKLIDAKKDLSVQVHPADNYALLHENSYGKAEIWYILDADEGACVYAGFNRKINKQELEESIGNGTIMELLKKIPVKKGDFISILPGTIHAIGAGVLLAEVQQNSDITYRVYDFDRSGPDGMPRELHIEKALDVVNFESNEDCLRVPDCEKGIGFSRENVSMLPYFEAYVYHADETVSLSCDEDSFHSVVVLDGGGVISFDDHFNDINTKKGESVFIPAGTGKYSIRGNCSFLLTYAGKSK